MDAHGDQKSAGNAPMTKPQPRRAGESPNERLSARVDHVERRLLQVENALRGVTRRAPGVSVGGPCAECGRSLLLVDHDVMYCPQCGYRQPL